MLHIYRVTGKFWKQLLKWNVVMLNSVFKLSTLLPFTVMTFGFGYLVDRAPKLGHRTDGLWYVNNLPKVVT